MRKLREGIVGSSRLDEFVREGSLNSLLKTY
jgi:hypothetical protein